MHGFCDFVLDCVFVNLCVCSKLCSDFCDPPCQNGATCGQGGMCLCHPGYTGESQYPNNVVMNCIRVWHLLLGEMFGVCLAHLVE